MLRRPLAHGGLFLSEHPLAGTGRVHQHHVKASAELGGERVRAHAGHNRVLHTEPLQVPRERLRTAAYRLVGDEQPRVPHLGGELGGLSARRGAKVEHGHAGRSAGQRCG
ncbi:hypothetical protein SDC9_119711 [bioreactor metagenome]|uniref:Uncharacterized protein n=1 Tax=bioreactor metagenome TaxID=1076179 RepID=A0A645C5A1_9ZZZZ